MNTEYERCKECTGKGCPKPRLISNHVDGPAVHWCDGQMRWLTLRERVRLFFGRLDLRALRP